ncbi:DUF4192 domain-containing protein [Actinokineospora bangkokensis]|uniref:DUF4192 domain-containing protein n=1 Tax=Actinokineospora bangkokensis TaxID=1193682 RepID=A0A1Q9LT63_9PSEU|nr:DUF4192 domain-containing protein [Actinokineospora bangkokensis]OLR95216.1 hypothetical protein BJP25_07965 [Actinokineospora bangkokensis]
MTTPLRTNLTIHDGGDLVAAIPNLLGFHPVDSVVLITVDQGEDEASVGSVVRANLPGPPHERDLADHLVDIAVESGATAALVVLLHPEELSHAGFVRTLADGLHAAGVTVPHVLWSTATAAGAPWRCYSDCGCSGAVRDPCSSPLAAAMAVSGAVTYPDRQSMVDTLAPDPEDVLSRRARMVVAVGALAPPDAAVLDATLARFAEAATADPPGPEPELGDRLLATIAHALTDPDIRGHCLGLALGDGARVAERLWTRLTRALPAPHRAAPASFLAVHAYLRGDGALARMALDRARAADPGQQLPEILLACLDRALPPDKLRELLAKAAQR